MMAAVYLRLQTIVGCLLHTWCIVNFVVVCTVPASAFQGNMSITGSTEIGGNVTITCSWTLSQDEVFYSVQVRSLPAASGGQNNYYYQFTLGFSWPTPGSQRNDRMSYDSFNASDQRAVVRITNVRCSDQQNYSCYFTIGKVGSQANNVEQTSFLTVRVKPEAPVITIEPQSVHPAKEGIFLYEKSTVTATCSANLGTRKLGRLDWRIYIQDNPEYIDPRDPRIQPLKKVALLPSDPDCVERARQQLVTTGDQTKQEMVIVCLVQNSDFQNLTDRQCSDPRRDMCVQSPPIWFISRSDNTNVLIALVIAFLAIVAGIAVVVLFEKFLLRLCEKPKPPPRERIVSQQPPSPPPIQRPVYIPSSEYTEEEERFEEDFSDESETDKESEV